MRARLTDLELVAAGEGLPIPDDAEFYQAIPRTMWPYFNDLTVREACLPSGNGHFSARALARMYAPLANGGEVDGVRLCSPERIKEMQRQLYDTTDRVLMVPCAGRSASGWEAWARHPTVRSWPGRWARATAFGHSGAGGSVGFADPEIGLAVAVTLNKMAYPMPGEGVTVEICDLVRRLTSAPEAG